MFVTAADEYGFRHNLPICDVLQLFTQHHVFQKLQDHYDSLHMMDLTESSDFVEDILMGAEQ